MYINHLDVPRNPEIFELPRTEKLSNSQWLDLALRDLQLPGDWTLVVLLGGRDLLAFRLRMAQSHFRQYMEPSYWSDCLLISAPAGDIGQSSAFHVPLMQPELPFPPARNGVVETLLSEFDSVETWPNIALLAYPVERQQVLDKLELFVERRQVFDSLANVLRWLAFAWGVNGAPNPVHEQVGLPSACMLDMVCSAAGLNVAQTLTAYGACPEVIWGSANYWQRQRGGTANYNYQAPLGRYFVGHRYEIDGTPATADAATAPRRATRSTPAAKPATRKAAAKTTARKS
ncbi:hypothetical protein [Pseudomonas sp. DP-17]|uniref:hypothetical protein n=1 Tax=Pseudomonas sp. DP-17 TaxID=1580486 RepID=UPI001EFB046A|nr:hypothetical protein [Pseudomonas sp. DP-17]MCG8907716.1 hypothetical protein [Pseudomonas sp. DP-17]